MTEGVPAAAAPVETHPEAPPAEEPVEEAPAPPEPEETLTAAQRALKEIRNLSIGRRGEFVAAAEKFLKDFADAPEAAEVRTLLADVKAKLTEEAEAALKTATAAAEAHLAQGKYKEAAGAFDFLVRSFGETDWYRTRGKEAIDEVLKRIEDARVAYETAGLTIKDDFSGYEEGSNGSPKWTLPGGWKMTDGVLLADSPGSGKAWLNTRDGKHVMVEVTVTPKKRLADGGWAMVGVTIFRDPGNFWVLAFIEGPDGARYMEFNEAYNGAWMAQFANPKLTCTQAAGCAWTNNHSYRMRLEMTPDGITGIVKETDGREITRGSYKFDNDAVKTGKPGVTANAFQVEYDDLTAMVMDEGASWTDVTATGTGAKGGAGREFYLSRGVVTNLAKYYDGARVTPKKLAAIGGGAAASNSFDALLKKNLPGGEGYSFAGKYGLAADRKTVAAALKSFETRLQMEKPETVRICFDSTDVVMGRTNPEIQRDLERIVQKVLDLGAVPVLFTLPMLAPPDANTRGVLLTFA